MHEHTARLGSHSEAASAIKDLLGGVAATAAAAGAIHTDSFTQNATSAIFYELDAADVALRRSRRNDVREFAARMRDDFARIRADLNSFLAGTAGPTEPPAQAMKLHQVLLDDLTGAGDEHFDERYLAQQKLAHLEAVTLFKSYRKFGGNDGLRNLCRLGLPVLEEHQHMLARIEHPRNG